MHTATVSLLKMPEEHAGYRVIDPKGREIGRVKELFVNADDEFSQAPTPW
jgi:sporulation protein YlmC with PRC-barrel domain